MSDTFSNVPLLLWIVLVLLAWIGWGSAAGNLFGICRNGTGLKAAWGMALTALVGGALNATFLCSRTSLTLWTVAGAGFAVPDLVKAIRRLFRRPAARLRSWLPSIPLVVSGIILVISSTSALDGRLNVLDDPPFYLVLPLRMLQTGAAVEPLNGRRLSTFGGFAFLQAQVGVVGDEWATHVVDKGLSSVVLMMLIVGIGSRKRGWRWTALISGTMCWLFPLFRANTMAALAITTLVFAGLRSVLLADRRPAFRMRLLILAAATLTAACTFRDNILALPPVFFVLYFAHRQWTSKSRWQATLKEMTAVIATGLLTLTPWSIALYEACGSFLYPVMKGNQRDSYFDFALPDTPTIDRLEVVQQMLLSRPFLLTYLPILFLFRYRHWTAIWMFVATVTMAAITAYSFPAADMGWLERFNVPALLASALFAFDLALRPPPRLRMTWAVLVISMFAAGAYLWPFAWTIEQFRFKAKAIADVSHDRAIVFTPSLVNDYAALQTSVPVGATIASVLDYPTMLNFARNPIYCIDTPGGATKAGLWPYQGGIYALKNFLKAQGVQYVLFEDFAQTKGLYCPSYWIRLLPAHDRTAPRMLDMMATVEALARVSPIVHQANGFTAFRVE